VSGLSGRPRFDSGRDLPFDPVHPELFVDVVVFVSSFGEKSFFTAGAATAATLEFGEWLSQCVQPCGALRCAVLCCAVLCCAVLWGSRVCNVVNSMMMIAFDLIEAGRRRSF
jgi:hypothetical protein